MPDHKKINELKKRIDHLNTLLLQKKTLIDNEMNQVENICKELMKLHEQYNALINSP